MRISMAKNLLSCQTWTWTTTRKTWSYSYTFQIYNLLNIKCSVCVNVEWRRKYYTNTFGSWARPKNQHYCRIEMEKLREQMESLDASKTDSKRCVHTLVCLFLCHLLWQIINTEWHRLKLRFSGVFGVHAPMSIPSSCAKCMKL